MAMILQSVSEEAISPTQGKLINFKLYVSRKSLFCVGVQYLQIYDFIEQKCNRIIHSNYMVSCRDKTVTGFTVNHSKIPFGCLLLLF